MPGTWAHWSKRVLGYVAKQTPINERYVALHKIQHHINQGHDDAAISRVWNQGNAGPCVVGVNSSGVAYNSCAYERKVMAYLN